MKPEEKARVKIDQMFEDAGWKVVDRDFYTPTLTAAAIREGLLEGNREADYFLFINGMAVGVLEAKRKEVDVTSDKVCEQADLYARGVPECYKAYSRPLPIIYQSNGEETFFRDFRDEDGELIELNRIHTPKEIVKMLGIDDTYAGLPTLKKKVCVIANMKLLRNWRIVSVRDRKGFDCVGNRSRQDIHCLSGSLPPLGIHSHEAHPLPS